MVKKLKSSQKKKRGGLFTVNINVDNGLGGEIGDNRRHNEEHGGNSTFFGSERRRGW